MSGIDRLQLLLHFSVDRKLNKKIDTWIKIESNRWVRQLKISGKDTYDYSIGSLNVMELHCSSMVLMCRVLDGTPVSQTSESKVIEGRSRSRLKILYGVLAFMQIPRDFALRFLLRSLISKLNELIKECIHRLADFCVCLGFNTHVHLNSAQMQHACTHMTKIRCVRNASVHC